MKSIIQLAALLVLAFALPQLFGRSVKNNAGQTLPKLDVKYIGGTPALAGKPMILEFWATWCPPCRESISHLNDVYKQYQAKGLEIIGVTKEDVATVTAFTKEMPINYHIALDPDAVLAAHFGITGIPHAMLVDKTGKIIWEGHPIDLKPADIESLLK
jgi:thiol-disulfide isomerase/thioredoxin